jgi:hypothetical protein
LAGALGAAAGGAACVVQAETGVSFEGTGTGALPTGALDALAALGEGADCLAGGDGDVLAGDAVDDDAVADIPIGAGVTAGGDCVGTEDTMASIAGIGVGDGALATRSDATFNVRFAAESLLGSVGGRVAPGTPPVCR